ncbi:unnamed protein product [Boreogadus saida]
MVVRRDSSLLPAPERWSLGARRVPGLTSAYRLVELTAQRGGVHTHVEPEISRTTGEEWYSEMIFGTRLACTCDTQRAGEVWHPAAEDAHIIVLLAHGTASTRYPLRIR